MTDAHAYSATSHGSRDDRATDHNPWPMAIITLIVMVGNLALGVFNVISTGVFPDTESFLHNILAVAVGLEFVRMLVDMTPANILEVLTVAITRHVVRTHEDPLSNLASVACIAGLFAIRRYLIRRSELKEELVEWE